ncbi:AHH domain-containing protein [Variovorax sp. GT1P44]|uniref:AHH domain-containing protein n=1 Tax=Variovorax sp. GT1P44 TaxID=3443742 RepID=UPI003F460A67
MSTQLDRSTTTASIRLPGQDLLDAFARERPPTHRMAPAVRLPRYPTSAPLRIALVRQLQRTHGNNAVQHWVDTHRASKAQAQAPHVAHDSHDSQQRPASVTDAPATAPLTISRTPSPSLPGPGPIVQRGAADALAAVGEAAAWKVANQIAPQLTPILRKGPQGVLDWLKERASAAADAVFDSFMSPVRAITGVGAKLSAQFTPLVGVLQDAAAKIATNDCSPISKAADQIEKTAEKIITPIVEKLQPVVAKVQGFLSAAWDKIGSPIWEWFKDYAGQQWEQVKQLASWIWQLSEPLRSLGQDAWTWLKNKLGIGDGPDGENGILQWAQGKLSAAWSGVKALLEPFGKQVAVVRAGLAAVADTLTGPISTVGSLVTQVGKGIGWLASHLANGKSIVEARSYVEKSLIPPLIDGLRRSSGAVIGLARSMTGALDKVASGLNGAAGAIGNSVLRVAASAVQWIASEITAVAGWASQKLGGAATWLGSAIGQLEHFLQGLADFLSKLAGVASNVWGLPMFLAGKVWNWIPACIRDPVVDFVVPIILRQIELFADLARDNDAWQKTKTQVMGIVRKVFVDRDLVGAVKASFNLVLRVLNIPEDMLGKVAAKAMAAWDVVSKKPLEFIKNTVRSLGHGFKLLWDNIGTHLAHGIEGWLFGELADKDIHPPQSWSDPKALFGFVVEVLGLSMGHVTDLLKKRIDPKLVDKVQGWIGRFAKAWDWITGVINTSKSPAENSQGLLAKAKDFGTSILTGAVEWIVGKVAAELAMLSAAAAASGGLSEVIDVARRIYKAMLTAKRWAGRILQMASDTLDNVLDIASGNVSKVGGQFEKIMDKAMPVVIGFLADQVGLGGIGAAIRNIIDKLREKVDDAILWLIDKAKAGIEAVLGGIKAGVAALEDWFGLRKDFTAQGKPHTLYFVGTGHSARLAVASNETFMEDLLEPNGELETDVLKSEDAARIGALHRARSAYAKVRVSQSILDTTPNDTKASDALKSAADDLVVCLRVTGVEVLAADDAVLKKGTKLVLVGGKSEGWPISIDSIDIKSRNFKYTVDEDCSIKSSGSLGFASQNKSWRLYKSDADYSIQCHHKIPWENSTYAHNRHDLRKLSKVDLYSDHRNTMWVGGHRSRHSESYHLDVKQLMERAWNGLPQAIRLASDTDDAAREAANKAIGSVMRDIESGIRSKKIKLYDPPKEVWIPFNRGSCKP